MKPLRESSDWYLREWAALKGKRQADLVRELGWLPPRVNKIWNGSIPYRRDLVNALASWLGVEPFELLMPPDRARSIRRIAETARLIAAEDGVPFDRES